MIETINRSKHKNFKKNFLMINKSKFILLQLLIFVRAPDYLKNLYFCIKYSNLFKFKLNTFRKNVFNLKKSIKVSKFISTEQKKIMKTIYQMIITQTTTSTI